MRFIILLFLTVASGEVVASNLQLSKPIFYKEGGQAFALVNISWENAWHNQRNHDAVWIFFKFLRGDSEAVHVKLLENGHQIVSIHKGQDLQLDLKTPSDRAGVFLYPSTAYRGTINATLKILLDQESFKRVKLREADFSSYGLEMVQIPEGSFTLGEPDTAVIRWYGNLYQSDAKGRYKGLYTITEEKQEIQVAPTEGALYYQASSSYNGDQTGIIPTTFPKGVAPFYIMKYEPTQGQYADFLNSLSVNQSQNRANFGGKNYYKLRGSIYYKDGQYKAKLPSTPCNHMSWDDAMAYADWAGLRPMTEFEFTKAARGPAIPQKREFPWGSNSKEQIQRVVSENSTLTMLNGWEESKLSDENKAVFGASYYWVMDLAGSLWERVITIGHPKGRAFTGTHGDGKLTNYGFATNKDWPKGIEETGGFGFRGGGFYGHGRDYHEFNPYSPISYRPYGGWSGGNRTEAYGTRFVRSIP